MLYPLHELVASGGDCLNEHPRLIEHVEVNCVTSRASEQCHYWSLQKNDYNRKNRGSLGEYEWLMLIRHEYWSHWSPSCLSVCFSDSDGRVTVTPLKTYITYALMGVLFLDVTTVQMWLWSGTNRQIRLAEVYFCYIRAVFVSL